MVRHFGGQLKRARIFYNSLRLTAPKALVRSTKAAYRPLLSSLHFSCICLCTKMLFVFPLLDLKPHWLSDVFFCAIVGISLFSKTPAKILSAMESGVMPR